LDQAFILDDDADNFFLASEKLSQDLRGQAPIQTGLLGLDGPVTPLKVELETYFKLPHLPSSKLNVLEWWKTQSSVLPLLSAIARKYLCIPASSAPSERLFSSSGNVVTKLRSSLDPKNVDMIVYLHENMSRVNMKYDINHFPTPQANPAEEEAVALD
jgi:hypothetical protein